MTRLWRLLGLVLPLGGCLSIGAGTLRRDQADYATALTEAAKEQTLLNIVRLRYSDPPAFLSVNQIIAGYTVQGGAQAGLNAYAAAAGNFVNALGTFQYEDHPTFTFTPVTGDQYARSYLRPLSPADLLPLAQSGVPIDILFVSVRRGPRINLPFVPCLLTLSSSRAATDRFPWRDDCRYG